MHPVINLASAWEPEPSAQQSGYIQLRLAIFEADGDLSLKLVELVRTEASLF